MNVTGSKRVHCLGVGGIGVSALARYFVTLGWDVSGCDLVHATPIVGVRIMEGHDPSHIINDRPALLIHSPAVPEDHPEIVLAKERGIPVMDYPTALGMIAQSVETVTVTGTHGKSTTTALLGHMLARGGKDPMVVVGAIVPGFEGNYRPGRGGLFVVEGCEYRRGMLKIHPRHAIITNVEADHLDSYRDLEDVIKAFESFVKGLPPDGILVYNVDDSGARRAALRAKCRTITFGASSGAHVRGATIVHGEGGTVSTIWSGKEELGTITTELPGTYNLMNILAATSMALALGVPFSDISDAIRAFKGIGRRFEKLGRMGKTEIISDYAHHPTALLAITQAARARYPGKRIMVAFQPHQTNRTIKLAKEFVEVFTKIPELVVVEIYRVKGREEDDRFSVASLVEEANQRRSVPITFVSTLPGLKEHLLREGAKYDVLLCVGAGDIDTLARDLVS